MKPSNLFLFFSLVIFFSFQCNAQMVAEHTYGNNNPISMVALPNDGSAFTGWGGTMYNLAISGRKYAVCENGNLKLYNLDHSLWKTIAVPYGTAGSVNIYYVSENLFKLDGKVQYAAAFTYPNYSTDVYVFDEDGDTLNFVSGMYAIHLYKSAADSTIAIVGASTQNMSTRVFSLPGNLPCEQCIDNAQLKVANTNPLEKIFLSDPIPNPGSDHVRISYILPENVNDAELRLYNTNGRVIKKYRVSGGKQSINIDLPGLATGEYYYQLSSGKGCSSAKKLIIAK